MKGKAGIHAYMHKTLEEIFGLREADFRSTMASLRRGVGREPGEIPELLGQLLLSMPEEMMDSSGRATAELRACYAALTLFAMHQQGHSQTERMSKEDASLGSAVAHLITNEEEFSRVQRRFNMMATSDDLNELQYHFRTIVRMLSDKSLPVDYVTMAEDFYRYQFMDNRPAVRLKWGQDFYRTVNKKEDKKDE